MGSVKPADPERVLDAMAVPGYDVKTLLLEPGDVAFTHSNPLHCLLPNDSSRWRRNVIVAYNSKGNEPLDVPVPVQPPHTKVEVVPDTAFLDKGCIKLSAARADFLGQEMTEKHIKENPTLTSTDTP